MASLPSMVDLHQRTLQRRLVHLRERVRKGNGTGAELAFDKNEAAALDWALSFINEHIAPQHKPVPVFNGSPHG